MARPSVQPGQLTRTPLSSLTCAGRNRHGGPCGSPANSTGYCPKHRDQAPALVILCGECDGKAPERCGTCIANAEDASAARLGIASRVSSRSWGDTLTRNLEEGTA